MERDLMDAYDFDNYAEELRQRREDEEALEELCDQSQN